MSDFKGRRFPTNVILVCVRWYCKYGISYRDLEEMMQNAASWSITRRYFAGFSATRRSWKTASTGISVTRTLMASR